MYQIRNDIQKAFQQHDEITSQTVSKQDQRINSLRIDLNLLEEQTTQRLTSVSITEDIKLIIRSRII